MPCLSLSLSALALALLLLSSFLAVSFINFGQPPAAALTEVPFLLARRLDSNEEQLLACGFARDDAVLQR